MSQLKIIVLLCITFLVSGGQGISKSQTVYAFYLQPWQNSNIYINGVKLIPNVSEKDNSLALVKVDTGGREHFQLKIENEKFQSFEKKINLKSEQKDRKIPQLIQLAKSDSLFQLYNTWPTGKEPKSVAFISNEDVILPLLDGNAFDIVNIHTGKTQRISIPAEEAKRNGFVESLVIPEKKEIWVSQMTTARIHVFDLETYERKKTIQLSGSWSKVLFYDAKKQRVYCSNWISRDVSVIDANTYKEMYRIGTEAVPRGMLLSSNGKYLYVTQFSRTLKSEGDGKIIKIDLEERKIVGRIGVNGSKRHIVGDNQYYYVSDMAHERIEVYSLKDDTLVKNIKVFFKPNTIVLSPNGHYLYISCRGPNNPAGYELRSLQMGQIHVLDTQSLEVIDYWEGGNQSTGLDISPDGKYIVTSDFKDNRVRVYDKIR